jgi:hypothetical protein
MPDVHHSFWLTPWYRQPHHVVNYWRGFIGQPDTGTEWNAKVRLCFAASVVFFEALDHWRQKLYAGSDTFQRRALEPVERELDRAEQQLRAIETSLKASDNISSVWAGAALPLVFAPGSVVQQLTSIRNQLLALGAPPPAKVVAAGESVDLEDIAGPSWPADWFRKMVSDIYAQAETSAPGEPTTAGDIAKSSLESAQENAAAAWEATKEAAATAASSAGDVASWAPWLVGGWVAWKVLGK